MSQNQSVTRLIIKVKSVEKNKNSKKNKLTSTQKTDVFWNIAGNLWTGLCNIIGEECIQFFWSLLKWVFCLINMGNLKVFSCLFWSLWSILNIIQPSMKNIWNQLPQQARQICECETLKVFSVYLLASMGLIFDIVKSTEVNGFF